MSAIEVRGKVAADACVLLIVDVQNDFCHPDAPIGRHLRRDVVDAMCAAISELRTAARRSGVPLVWVRTVHRDATDSQAWLRRLPSGAVTVCREASWGARFYKLEPGPQDIVMEKHRYSAFHGTELTNILRTLRRDTVVVVGTATNVCVESTVRDACMSDYEAVLVDDATCAATDQEHAAALVNVKAYFGSVVDSTTLVGVWTERVPESFEPEQRQL